MVISMENQRMTPHELTQKTIADIAKRRQLKKDGERQALDCCMRNRDKIWKRISRCR